MVKTISSSDLRTQIKRVLNEVGYGQVQYLVDKFGEPIAAIISMDDFRLLEAAKREQAATLLREVIAGVRARSVALDPAELDALVEQARDEFYQLRSSQSHAC